MDSTRYGDMFAGGCDGAMLTPIWRGAMLATTVDDTEPVMVDFTAACRALTDPDRVPVMEHGPYQGWLLVPAPRECPRDSVLLSPDGHVAIRLELADLLTAHWSQQADGREDR
ncbi:hypothetical protein [Actinoplanes derwentensis]|uniref:Uncharacterized protein n=1 Tax=Actinoplanes derwentensis TaxID=113562 RepID=A0A1H1ZWS2_9ACTN|nr:hypothetical protein [Actinoplanes derwentensis]GID83509.1 hypothetical protein Ade03nite_24330 [Actinoplanes derwentensis]SDT38017.1 hypothetical protein SAMN04489716_3533 [Actinoplanes derwentensis]